MANQKLPCQLCGIKQEDGIEIFSEEAVKLSLKSIILQHFSLEFTETGDDSKIVCTKCWKITSDFHELYCLVKDVITVMHHDTQSVFPVTIFSKTEYNEGDDNNEYYDEQHLDDTLDLSDVEMKFVTCNGNMVDDNLQSGKLAVKEISQLGNDNFKPESEDDSSRLIKKNITIKPISKKQLLANDQDEEIRNSLGIICELCNENFQTFPSLIKHFKQVHNMVGYVRCCGRKYRYRSSTYDHIKNHNNPDRPQCSICNKQFMDYCQLKTHMKKHETRTIKCPFCMRYFYNETNLEEHIQLIHLNAPKTFICDFCEKGFISKKKIWRHITYVHVQQTSRICDVCAKTYKTTKQLNTHYKTIHLGIKIPKVQCKVCGSWLMNQDSLRNHLRHHYAKKETCPICGKVTTNRNTLSMHIRKVHTENKFPCIMCGKKYKKEKSLTDHMTTHTGYNLYKCKYCSMEFHYESAFYKHRKDVHTIEFEEERRLKLIKSKTPD